MLIQLKWHPNLCFHFMIKYKKCYSFEMVRSRKIPSLNFYVGPYSHRHQPCVRWCSSASWIFHHFSWGKINLEKENMLRYEDVIILTYRQFLKQNWFPSQIYLAWFLWAAFLFRQFRFVSSQPSSPSTLVSWFQARCTLPRSRTRVHTQGPVVLLSIRSQP